MADYDKFFAEFRDFISDNDAQNKFLSLLKEVLAIRTSGLFSPITTSAWLSVPLSFIVIKCHFTLIMGVIYQLVFLTLLPESGVVCWDDENMQVFDSLTLNFKVSFWASVLTGMLRFSSYIFSHWLHTAFYITVLVVATLRTSYHCYVLATSGVWEEISKHMVRMLKSPSYRQMVYAWREFGDLCAIPDSNSSHAYIDARSLFITKWQMLSTDLKDVGTKTNAAEYFDFAIPSKGLHSIEYANLNLMRSRAIYFIWLIQYTKGQNTGEVVRYNNIVNSRLAGLKLESIFSIHSLFLIFGNETDFKARNLQQKWMTLQKNLIYVNK